MRRGDDWSDVSVVEIAENQEPRPVKLVLSRENSANVSVCVVGRDGQAASGAFVFAEVPAQGVQILTTDIEGRATARIAKPFPSQVRFAALAGDSWVLGGWQAWDRVRQGSVLAVGKSGVILLQSEKTAGVLQILSTDGWDVAWLMARVGINPSITPGSSASIGGLPEGNYRLAVGQWSDSVTVEERRQASVKLP